MPDNFHSDLYAPAFDQKSIRARFFYSKTATTVTEMDIHYIK